MKQTQVLRLSKNKKLWIDGGVFPSHIGFESFVGIDCWNLTRSLLAVNSPYYESGIKLSYTSDKNKWFLSTLAFNSWQRLQRQAGKTVPAFGHQLIIKPDEKLLFNSSFFIGSEAPDSVRRMRYFHNF